MNMYITQAFLSKDAVDFGFLLNVCLACCYVMCEMALS